MKDSLSIVVIKSPVCSTCSTSAFSHPKQYPIGKPLPLQSWLQIHPPSFLHLHLPELEKWDHVCHQEAHPPRCFHHLNWYFHFQQPLTSDASLHNCSGNCALLGRLESPEAAVFLLGSSPRAALWKLQPLRFWDAPKASLVHVRSIQLAARSNQRICM
jgi:hypothetical protein